MAARASLKHAPAPLTRQLADEDRAQATRHVRPAPRVLVAHRGVGHAADLEACTVVWLRNLADLAPMHVGDAGGRPDALVAAAASGDVMSNAHSTQTDAAHLFVVALKRR